MIWTSLYPQRLNAETISMFTSDCDMTDALTTMVNLILPSLAQLAHSDLKEDTEVVEKVRGQWCQLLETQLSGKWWCGTPPHLGCHLVII